MSQIECIQKAEVPYRVRWAEDGFSGDLTILSPEASQAYFSTKVRSAKRCALDDIPVEEELLHNCLDIFIDEPSETMKEEIRVLKQEKEEMQRQLAIGRIYLEKRVSYIKIGFQQIRKYQMLYKF